MGTLDARAGLAGKVAAVIGGAAGIGAAVSEALGSAGVDVALCDHNAPAIEGMRARLASLGRAVLAEALDVTDSVALARFYGAIRAHFPRLDIVVNVVGGVRRRGFMEATPAECAADVQRNYGYLLESFRHAIPLIRRGGQGGSIISFTTIEAHRGAAGFAVYAGAKAAATNFSRAMAVELGPERIRVNTIAPDTTPSEGNALALAPETRAAMAAAPPRWMEAALRMYIPLGAPPAVEDLANGVLFLASDLAKSVTGTTLHIDGGTFAASGFLQWPHGDGFLPVPLANTQRRLFD